MPQRTLELMNHLSIFKGMGKGMREEGKGGNKGREGRRRENRESTRRGNER